MDIIDEGSGEAVVLVHGGASSNRQWKALIEALRGELRVLAPNLHGAGAMPLAEGGHMAPLTRPGDVNPLIRAFLS